MMKTILIFGLAAAASAAGAQAGNTASSTSTTHNNSPVGQVTETRTTYPMGNGSYTTTTVSPGNGSGVRPYAGSSTLDPHPNTMPSTTSYHGGIIVPFGEGARPTSSSSSKPKSNGSAATQR
jgi:hypothetical protein